jgi:hypothetical protein
MRYIFIIPLLLLAGLVGIGFFLLSSQVAILTPEEAAISEAVIRYYSEGNLGSLGNTDVFVSVLGKDPPAELSQRFSRPIFKGSCFCVNVGARIFIDKLKITDPDQAEASAGIEHEMSRFGSSALSYHRRLLTRQAGKWIVRSAGHVIN